MKRTVALSLTVALLAAAALARPASANPVGVRWEPMSLPVTIGGTGYKLDAILAYPDDGARHPLAIVSHGSPRVAADRPGMLPAADAGQILWYVHHGWTVASVLRRGYGRSDGGWAETYGTCANPDYAGAGRRGAADIAASIAALADNPHVDASRVLAVGVSAGGFATVALSAAPPPGLVAAIAFAPGRGSSASDDVCAQDRLVDAFAQYGKTSRLPLLWISAANDHFFDPPLVRRLVAAFNGAGGRATFLGVPASGGEGHYFFSASDGVRVWEPAVVQFLDRNGFAFVERPLDLAMPAVPVPAELGPRGRAAFARYTLDPPHKAFAAARDGRFGYAFGSSSAATAAATALSSCDAAGASCAVVNTDGATTK
jgi:dienelactone hydrolase